MAASGWRNNTKIVAASPMSDRTTDGMRLPHSSRRAALGHPADRSPARGSSDFSSYQAPSLPGRGAACCKSRSIDWGGCPRPDRLP